MRSSTAFLYSIAPSGLPVWSMPSSQKHCTRHICAEVSLPVVLLSCPIWSENEVRWAGAIPIQSGSGSANLEVIECAASLHLIGGLTKVLFCNYLAFGFPHITLSP